ncbi:hypothetical protein LSAT2_001400 [Lamellibrachia satsuma]|nr:hypothetical protein LSAT2_001400 [Lamellibrachia satsuma]
MQNYLVLTSVNSLLIRPVVSSSPGLIAPIILFHCLHHPTPSLDPIIRPHHLSHHLVHPSPIASPITGLIAFITWPRCFKQLTPSPSLVPSITSAVASAILVSHVTHSLSIR